MTRITGILLPFLLLAACQIVPHPGQNWAAYLEGVDRLDPEQLLLERETAVRTYTAEPTDANRLKAGYALSRTPASPGQLEESRRILAEIAGNSELAPMRDLLDGEIEKFMALQDAETRAQELRSESDQLKSRVSTLEEQLDAVKEIETEMNESQQEPDGMHQ